MKESCCLWKIIGITHNQDYFRDYTCCSTSSCRISFLTLCLLSDSPSLCWHVSRVTSDLCLLAFDTWGWCHFSSTSFLPWIPRCCVVLIFLLLWTFLLIDDAEFLVPPWMPLVFALAVFLPNSVPRRDGVYPSRPWTLLSWCRNSSQTSYHRGISSLGILL